VAESVEEAEFIAFSKISAPATTKRVDDLLIALDDGDWVNRLDAVRSLGETGDERAIRPLAYMASEDDSSWVRAMVASSLVKLGKRGLLDRIIEALYDEDPVVRGNAAAALGEIGDPRAKDALIDLLKDEAEAVRRAAREALEKIGAY
jgi:HEAT repeat protein